MPVRMTAARVSITSACSGKLARDGHDVLLDFTDLQLTRGARLERAPALNVRLSLEPGSVAHRAHHACGPNACRSWPPSSSSGLLAPQVDAALPAAPGDWLPTAGVVARRELRFRRRQAGHAPLDFQRARLGPGTHAILRSRADLRSSRLNCASMRANSCCVSARRRLPACASRRRPRRGPSCSRVNSRWSLTGATPAWRFAEFSAASGPTNVTVNGGWNQVAARGAATETRYHRTRPRPVAGRLDTRGGRSRTACVARRRGARQICSTPGSNLTPGEDGAVNWSRSNGALHFAELAVTGDDMPRLSDGRGALTFARGTTQLRSRSGHGRRPGDSQRTHGLAATRCAAPAGLTRRQAGFLVAARGARCAGSR